MRKAEGQKLRRLEDQSRRGRKLGETRGQVKLSHNLEGILYGSGKYLGSGLDIGQRDFLGRIFILEFSNETSAKAFRSRLFPKFRTKID